MDAERVHDVGAMDRHGVDAQVELLGDLAVREAVADELQDLELARREPVIALALERRPLRHARIEDGLAGRDRSGRPRRDRGRARSSGCSRARPRRAPDAPACPRHAC